MGGSLPHHVQGQILSATANGPMTNQINSTNNAMPTPSSSIQHNSASRTSMNVNKAKSNHNATASLDAAVSALLGVGTSTDQNCNMDTNLNSIMNHSNIGTTIDQSQSDGETLINSLLNSLGSSSAGSSTTNGPQAGVPSLAGDPDAADLLSGLNNLFGGGGGALAGNVGETNLDMSSGNPADLIANLNGSATVSGNSLLEIQTMASSGKGSSDSDPFSLILSTADHYVQGGLGKRPAKFNSL